MFERHTRLGRRALPVLVAMASVVMLTPTARGQDDRETLKGEILTAIDRGKDFLLSRQRGGLWYARESPDYSEAKDVGATALAAVALMECGVSTGDERIRQSAAIIRRTSRDPKFNYTYGVNLCILFLHRVNQVQNNGWSTEHGDAGLIRELAKRVIAGQDRQGGWNYFLTPNGSDNSNTQFSVVGLWVARRYFPEGTAERKALYKALQLTETKFRNSQQGAAWAYDSTMLGTSLPPSPSMTCAALLGLAVGAGQRYETEFRGAGAGSGQTGRVEDRLAGDRQINLAKQYLESSLKMLEKGISPQGEHLIYFLWSLERVCVLYRWRTIGEVDWHAVGSKYLIEKQGKSGAWSLYDHDGVNPETSFAMLFLIKSNLLGPLYDVEFRDGPITAGMPEKKPVVRRAPPETAEQIKQLFEDLPRANPTQRHELLQYAESLPGDDVTTKLADTVAKMPTENAKRAVRDALANRLAAAPVLKLDTLLRESDHREVRLAALRAATSKREDKEREADARSKTERSGLILTLITFLNDADKELSDQALLALQAMTEQNFGKNIARWQRWLDMSKK